MMRTIYIFLASLIFMSCGTQQKVVKNSSKETKTTTSIATKTVIDSITVEHNKVATNDSLNIIKKGEFVFVKKPNDRTVLVGEVSKNTKDLEEKKQIIFSHNTFNNLLQKHVTTAGNVNYKGFKSDRAKLRAYIVSLGENTPTDDWLKEEKLAYWINAYNALTVDLILRNYPLKSIKDIKKPWDQRLWKLGEKWQNLNDIEHKILRKMDEPRIHFAINCASFSCPPLLNEAFTAEKLEQQLTQVTKLFLADSRRNTITPDKIEISKIFKWFSKDFKQNGSLIDFLNTYSDVKINAKAKKKYKDYNWDLNE
ncbi:DUF547 domain-containing protein [Kordia sp.]|uniref:DUF547 domain-containing protein n=1 Tax=Kordia sp. TaxID=1965332 RepID=UPI003D6A1458